jgi:hypothetical protein
MNTGFNFPIPSMFNTNQTHPLIPNSQEYIYYKKYVSIHSEDRDIIKYPNASLFDIELPEDYLNVITVKLSNWTFPYCYYLFSCNYNNITMTFKITQAYNPGEFGLADAYQDAIFQALYYNQENDYVIQIEEGNYTPSQMATELTRKFNEAVSNYIIAYFQDNGFDAYIPTFISNGGYLRFVIVYNDVSKKFWFGNKSDIFVLTNDSETLLNLKLNEPSQCNQYVKNRLPDYSNYGLPGYIGLLRTSMTSINVESSPTTINDLKPRFYYGNVNTADNGYWLNPDPILIGSTVSFIEAPYVAQLDFPSQIYLELSGLNNLDETSPFTLNNITVSNNNISLSKNLTNGVANGVVNSAFAVIPTNPESNYFDCCQGSYKLFFPPAERIRKLQIKVRFHNGVLVDFNNCNYSFTLEFTLYNSQILRQYKLFQPALGKPIN